MYSNPVRQIKCVYVTFQKHRKSTFKKKLHVIFTFNIRTYFTSCFYIIEMTLGQYIRNFMFRREPHLVIVRDNVFYFFIP